jgi:hypothetical protein
MYVCSRTRTNGKERQRVKKQKKSFLINIKKNVHGLHKERLCIYALVCVVRARMLVILFDIEEPKEKKTEVRTCVQKKQRKIQCELSINRIRRLYLKYSSIYICGLSLFFSFTTIISRLSPLDIVVATSIESKFKAIPTSVYTGVPTCLRIFYFAYISAQRNDKILMFIKRCAVKSFKQFI